MVLTLSWSHALMHSPGHFLTKSAAAVTGWGVLLADRVGLPRCVDVEELHARLVSVYPNIDDSITMNLYF